MKKHLTRVMMGALSLLFLINAVPSVSAANANDFKETTNSKHQVIRTIKKSPLKTLDKNSKEYKDAKKQAKLDLLSLGMEQDFIDNQTDAQLQDIMNSESIKSIVSYCKVDAEGNTQYVSEADALQAANAINSATATTTFNSATFEDSYMRLYHSISYLGSGQYKFVSTARWLTMPSIRSKDSIGSAASSCTVVTGSQYGYIEYEVIKRNSVGDTIAHLYPVDTFTPFTSTQMKNAANGSFYGSAGVFTVPTNVMNSGVYTTECFNLKSYYEYKGKIVNPTLVTNFNSNGVYCHSTFAITIMPNVTIGLKANNSATIGVAVQGVKEYREAPLDAQYVP